VNADSLDSGVASGSVSAFPRASRSGQRAIAPVAWILCWFVTTISVFLGAWLGDCFVKSDRPLGFAESLARVDGQNYRKIVDIGYEYKENLPSSVAFFPAFPLAVAGLSRASGLDTVLAQLIISNACCFVAFSLMGAYLGLRGRHPHSDQLPKGEREDQPSPRPSLIAQERENLVASYALLAMGLLPTTFFFRVAYTESMYLCAAIAAIYGIGRGWRIPIVAVIVGLATAIRPVGIALLVPLAWYVWQSSTSKLQLVRRLACAIPLGCWGLLAYMAYQYWKFNEPLAFALTQEYHRMRPLGTLGDKVLSLLSWEPIREAYDSSSLGYWRNLCDMQSPLFSLEFANPIYLVGTAALITVGAWKRWLTSYEILLAIPLLVIPYVTRAYEMRMLSQGRFAAIVFPVYIVLGHLLARMPTVVAASLLALSGLMMGIYAALFAAGYPFL
jgi:hypothetical protein